MLPRNGSGEGPGGRFLEERQWRKKLETVIMETKVMMRIWSQEISIFNLQKQKQLQFLAV